MALLLLLLLPLPVTATPLPLSDVVPAFCDVCERAPGDKAPVCVTPLGLSEGGFVSDNGDWALTDAVGAVAACPRSCAWLREKRERTSD